MGSCIDLSEYQDSEKIQDAFSTLVSGGKTGYKTIIHKDKEATKCSNCFKVLGGDENFCPECGEKQGGEK